jgi:hypothetical protein
MQVEGEGRGEDLRLGREEPRGRLEKKERGQGNPRWRRDEVGKWGKEEKRGKDGRRRRKEEDSERIVDGRWRRARTVEERRKEEGERTKEKDVWWGGSVERLILEEGNPLSLFFQNIDPPTHPNPTVEVTRYSL